MKNELKVDGKTLHARILIADEWFDALDQDSPRDQDYVLISTCIVDADDNKVYEPAAIGKLPVTTYAKLYGMAMKANRPEKSEKK